MYPSLLKISVLNLMQICCSNVEIWPLQNKTGILQETLTSLLQWYAQATQPECRRRNTHCLPCVQRCVRSSCPFWQLVIQDHASCLSKKLSCTKILLTVHMWPVPIALNYSVENIRNDICHKIIYMKNPNSTHQCGACSRSPQLLASHKYNDYTVIILIEWQRIANLASVRLGIIKIPKIQFLPLDQIYCCNGSIYFKLE